MRKKTVDLPYGAGNHLSDPDLLVGGEGEEKIAKEEKKKKGTSTSSSS